MNNIFRLFSIASIAVVVMFIDLEVQAQTINDGPVELRVRVRDINTTFGGSSDASLAGIGFLPDDYTYNVWVRDNTGLGPAGWQGGGCLQSNFNPPGASADFNTQLFQFNYPGATVPTVFDVRVRAWEDDLPTDGALGICTGGKQRCNYDCCNECCGFGAFGVCVGVREEDDYYCDSNPFRTSVNYRIGNPCQWYDHGYLTRNTGSGSSDCNNYRPRIESYWRYIDGNTCGQPIPLGNLNSSGSITHINSNECYTNTHGPGSSGNDVFYRFSISQPTGVRISLCGGATWNTNVYILDASCNQLFFNNNGATCSPQSEIAENLCDPGDYIVVVDGNTAVESGLFTLTISEDPTLSFSVSIDSINPSCNGLSDGTATAIVTGGNRPYDYLWTPGGQTDSFRTGLADGVYTVQVTDDQNCVITESVTITEPTQPAVFAAGIDPTCNGGSDGRITIVNTTGGTPPYEYSAGGAFQNPPITNLGSGTYNVRVRDDHGCIDSTSVVLADPPRISINATSFPQSCSVISDGRIEVNPSLGASPYECAIGIPPVYGPCNPFTGLSANNYVISVRDNDGCEVQEQVTVTLEPALSMAVASISHVTCNGYSDGAFTINTNGGVAPVEFSIDSGNTYQAGSTFTGLIAQNYLVTARDGNGCINSINVQVTEPQVLVANTLLRFPISCNGDSDGMIVLSASGGTSPYQYSIDSITFNFDQSFPGLSGGTYQFYVRDANGCVTTHTESTLEPAVLTVSATSVTDASCAGIDDGVLIVAANGGTPPFKYSLNNGPFQNDTTFAGLAPGTYLIGVEDRNLCQGFDSITVGANVSLNATVNITHVGCNGENTGAIEINPAGGGVYDYSINDITFQASNTFSGLSAGNYTAIARDANGCKYIEAVSVLEPPVLSAVIDSTIGATCPNILDGAAYISSFGGAGQLTFNWSSGEVTEDIVNVSGGAYTLTITDTNNCELVLPVNIAQPAEAFPDISVEDVDCFGDSTGRLDLVVFGGVPQFSYLWSNGAMTRNLTDASAGIYYLTVTDAVGCEAYDTAIIAEPLPLSSTITATQVSCATSADADIDLTVTGGTGSGTYNYFWSNFKFTEDQTGVPAGEYTVQVEDGNGCTTSNTITINEAPGLEVNVNIYDVSCFGETDGQLAVSVSGGTQPYTYELANNVISDSVSGLAPGIYELVVTDSLQCEERIDILIDEPEILQVDVSSNDVLCFGDNTGIAIPFVTGGTGSYDFAWSTGDTIPALVDLVAGNYTLQVSDENDCVETKSVEISQPSELTVTTTPEGTACVSGEDGEVVVHAVGGIGPYQYSVLANRFQLDSLVTGLGAGNYGVQVIDDNGCRAYNSFTVIDPEGFSVELDPFVFIALGASIELEPVISDHPIDSLRWTPNQDISCDTCLNPTVSPIEDITYTIEVYDTNGCIAIAQTTVVVKDEYQLFIPNAFTPNGDGENDEFEVIDLGAAAIFDIQIFNRWGSLVFSGSSVGDTWDGTFNGKEAQQGVYIFKIQGAFLDGRSFPEESQTGTVTLLR